MKSSRFITTLLVVIGIITIIFISCISEKPVKQQEIPFTDEIQVKIKEGSLTKTKCTIIINDLTGKNNLYYEDDFYIQKYDDGKWVEPEHNPKIVAGVPIYPDDSGFLELDCYWDQWYGELPKGKYRLVKSVYMKKDNIDEMKSFYEYYDQFKFFVQFEINN